MSQVDEKKVNVTTTTKTKTNFNVLATMAMTQIPAIEELINAICNDYIDEDQREKIKAEMNEKYINKSHKDCKKMFNRFRKKNSRSKSGYVVFLSDPVVVKDLKKKYANVPMKRLNPMKGKLWKTLDKTLKDRYKLVGKLMTHKLIDISDENKKETIKTWVYDKTLEEINQLLSSVKEEVKPKKVKKTKPKKVVVESDSDSDSDSSDDEKEPVVQKRKKKRRMMDSDSDSDSEDEVDMTETEPIS